MVSCCFEQPGTCATFLGKFVLKWPSDQLLILFNYLLFIEFLKIQTKATFKSRVWMPGATVADAHVIFSREKRRQTYTVTPWRGSLTSAGPGKAPVPALRSSWWEKGRRVHGGKKAERSQAAFWILKCFECRAGFFWKAWFPPTSSFFFFFGDGGDVLIATQACVQHLSPTKDGIVKDCCAWQMVEYKRNK